MDIGLGLPISNPSRLIGWARRAEASGFDSLAMLDRLVFDNPEPLITLAALADSDSDPGAGPALFRLVRFWSRRWINNASQELTGEMRHVQHIQAVEAVDALRVAGQDATIAAVAHQLGLDDSGASRIVRDATTAGYLRRGSSTEDRRRAAVDLTEHGHELLAGSRRWQRHAFERLTADWDRADRGQLARHLRRLAQQLDLDS